MNILMMVTWYSPFDVDVMAEGVFHYEQAMALKKYSNVALYFPGDTSLRCDFQKKIEHGLLTYRRRADNTRFYYRLRNYIKDFEQIRKEFAPDIIHAHVAIGVGKIAIILGKLFHIPVIVTEHNPIELSGFDKWRNRWIVKTVYYNSHANICVSRDLKEKLTGIFPKAKYKVIYNGVINPASISEDGRIYARDGYINCCIAAMFYSEEIKGYQYLLPAIKRLVDKGYPMLLHICGDGKYFEYYYRMALDLGIADHCIFYGQCNRQKVYSIVSQMSFCVSASIFESAGVFVQEAMMLGKPLVVTKSGGANSLVNAKTAIIVETKSITALENGLEEMIQRRFMYDTEYIRKYAYHKFDSDESAKRYMKLYSLVLKK